MSTLKKKEMKKIKNIDKDRLKKLEREIGIIVDEQKVIFKRSKDEALCTSSTQSKKRKRNVIECGKCKKVREDAKKDTEQDDDREEDTEEDAEGDTEEDTEEDAEEDTEDDTEEDDDDKEMEEKVQECDWPNDLSEYEILRQENIRRNEAVLENLV